MAERSADEIQRDIEQARVTLASSVDEITYRTNPKRVSEGVKATLIAKAKTPQGQAVLGGAGVLVLVVVVRRFRRR
ncbi:DUF3618 domain-containing protein [Jatrophihabitans sp.]|uniref:DUF3618 domain-containing protein n=1 Tax=Jatrophihabitans sp. TaxID=1932789 RepID=UPI0030C730FA|nr:hypothetical protein [Jatrophihabitans sp.]